MKNLLAMHSLDKPGAKGVATPRDKDLDKMPDGDDAVEKDDAQLATQIKKDWQRMQRQQWEQAQRRRLSAANGVAPPGCTPLPSAASTKSRPLSCAISFGRKPPQKARPTTQRDLLSSSPSPSPGSSKNSTNPGGMRKASL